MRAWIALAAFGSTALAAVAAQGTLQPAGIFAMPERVAYSAGRLAVVPLGATSAKLDFALQASDGRTVTGYDRRLTKPAQFFAISSDFSDFEALAPALGPDGHLRAQLKVAKPGLYHIYADAQPRGIGRQVFRFDVPFGAAPAATPDPLLAAAAPTVLAGPYNVTLGSLELAVARPNLVRVHVAKGLKPATDLRPYLSATACVVLVSEKNLSYADARAFLGGAGTAAEVDPNETGTLPDNASVPADFNVMLTPPSPGVYKLWIQFRGVDRVYAAPFVLTAGAAATPRS